MNKKLEDMFIDVDLDKIESTETKDVWDITLDGGATPKEEIPKEEIPKGEAPKEEVDVLKILEEIVTSTQEADKAEEETDKSWKELKKEVEASKDVNLQKKLSEYEENISKERLSREQIEKSYETLKSEFDKLLQDKLVSDAQWQKAEKINEVVSNDPELQAIVAYSYKASDDNTYNDKLVSAAKEYLRKVWNIDVDDLLQQKGQDAKTRLADEDPTVTSPDWQGSLYGMFE